MNIIVLCITMALIGAFIGGLTNLLAIRMLFRPHLPAYIGKWKIPLTPGMIPKRQNEIAGKLGNLVSTHLVTTTSIQTKLKDPMYRDRINRFLARQWDEVTQKKRPISELLNEYIPTLTLQKMEEKMIDAMSHYFINQYDLHQNRTIHELLPVEANQAILDKLPKISQHILTQLETYVQSPAGKAKLTEIAEMFLRDKGFLGRLALQYVSEKRINEKIVPAIIDVLQSPETKETIEKMLFNEWNQLQRMRLHEIRKKYFTGVDEQLFAKKLVDMIGMERQVDKPLSDFLSPYSQTVKQNIIPHVTDRLIESLANRLPRMMEYLNVAELVENEVKNFEVKRLERLVIDIAKRELKMITFLGALLGGIIGIIQAALITWML